MRAGDLLSYFLGFFIAVWRPEWSGCLEPLRIEMRGRRSSCLELGYTWLLVLKSSDIRIHEPWTG